MNVNDSIYEFNLSYLHLVQKLLAEDRASSLFRLGLSVEVAEILDELSEEQIRTLSRVSHLICHFRIKGAQALKTLVQESRVDQLQQIHAGIVVANTAK